MSNNCLFAILLLAPLVGFLFNGLRFRSHNAILAGTVATVAVGISFICSCLLISQLSFEDSHSHVATKFFNWISIGGLNVSAGFVVDHISAVMALVVTGVGTLIHLFSIGYMAHDERPTKYFAYLNLFIFNMLLLILGENILIMFVGWEGVGLCSYLLIGFWFTDASKAAAGMKAFIVNRIGDAGFLIGIFLIFQIFGTLSFSEIIAALPKGMEIGWTGPITLACLCLFIGATGKSAQIPLYVWLPDAMAGPTPVSALIHAATMVTAGVYMIVRLNPMFLLAPNALHVVAVVGAMTALVAASIGMVQWDIKKILAYSTVSQLGYMFLACGVGAFGGAMFHLMTHAFFKALMFLGSGSVIHAMHEEQDIRKMGGLRKSLPITHFTFLMGWLAIIGMPPFAGFFSKDEILWQTFSSPLGSKPLYLIGLLAAMMTAFYMTRLMALTFWGASRVPKDVHPHESPATMTIPLVILAALSVTGGWLGIPESLTVFIPGNPGNLLEHWFHGSIEALESVSAHGPVIELALMGVSVAAAALAALLAFDFYIVHTDRPRKVAAWFGDFYELVLQKYLIDEFYQDNVVTPIVNASKGLWAYVDVGFIDKTTYVISDVVTGLGAATRNMQNGNLQQYALYIALGVAATIFLVLR